MPLDHGREIDDQSPLDQLTRSHSSVASDLSVLSSDNGILDGFPLPEGYEQDRDNFSNYNDSGSVSHSASFTSVYLDFSEKARDRVNADRQGGGNLILSSLKSNDGILRNQSLKTKNNPDTKWQDSRSHNDPSDPQPPQTTRTRGGNPPQSRNVDHERGTSTLCSRVALSTGENPDRNGNAYHPLPSHAPAEPTGHRASSHAMRAAGTTDGVPMHQTPKDQYRSEMKSEKNENDHAKRKDSRSIDAHHQILAQLRRSDDEDNRLMIDARIGSSPERKARIRHDLHQPSHSPKRSAQHPDRNGSGPSQSRTRSETLTERNASNRVFPATPRDESRRNDSKRNDVVRNDVVRNDSMRNDSMRENSVSSKISVGSSIASSLGSSHSSPTASPARTIMSAYPAPALNFSTPAEQFPLPRSHHKTTHSVASRLDSDLSSFDSLHLSASPYLAAQFHSSPIQRHGRELGSPRRATEASLKRSPTQSSPSHSARLRSTTLASSPSGARRRGSPTKAKRGSPSRSRAAPPSPIKIPDRALFDAEIVRAPNLVGLTLNTPSRRYVEPMTAPAAIGSDQDQRPMSNNHRTSLMPPLEPSLLPPLNQPPRQTQAASPRASQMRPQPYFPQYQNRQHMQYPPSPSQGPSQNHQPTHHLTAPPTLRRTHSASRSWDASQMGPPTRRHMMPVPQAAPNSDPDEIVRRGVHAFAFGRDPIGARWHWTAAASPPHRHATAQLLLVLGTSEKWFPQSGDRWPQFTESSDGPLKLPTAAVLKTQVGQILPAVAAAIADYATKLLTKQRDLEALEYLDLAGSLGSLEALMTAAKIYYKGNRRVKKDVVKAKRLYNRANLLT